jgi:serine/threonine protein kinase
LKFDPEVVVTDQFKDVMRSMLQKDPKKRAETIHLIQNEYFIMEDEELEAKIEETKHRMEAAKQEEEEKAAQKLEDNILSGFSALSLQKGGSADPKQAGVKKPVGGKASDSVKSAVKKPVVGKNPPSAKK